MTLLILSIFFTLLSLLLIRAGLRISRQPETVTDCAQPGQVNTDYKNIRWNKGN